MVMLLFLLLVIKVSKTRDVTWSLVHSGRKRRRRENRDPTDPSQSHSQLTMQCSIFVPSRLLASEHTVVIPGHPLTDVIHLISSFVKAMYLLSSVMWDVCA